MSKSKKGKKEKHLDDQFEAFLRESLSSEESLDTARVAKYLKPKPDKREEQPWWMKEVEEDHDDVGLSGTGKHFLKKKKPAVKEQGGSDGRSTAALNSASHDPDDSLDEESFGGRRPAGQQKSYGLGVPALSLGSTQSVTDTGTEEVQHGRGAAGGTDTLDEIADKEKFFKELEGKSDETIDYGKLNRELDREGTLGTLASNQGQGSRSQHRESEEYSDEFDTSRKEDIETSREQNTSGNTTKGEDGKPSMLSKVALLDSLNSTGGTKRASRDTRDSDMVAIPEHGSHDEDGGHHDEDGIDGPISDCGGGLKTTTGYGLTATSHEELEALQRALRDAGMSTLGSTLHDTLLSRTGKQTASDSSHREGTTTGTQRDATTTGTFGLKQLKQDSGKPQRTVEELMREVEQIEQRQDSENRGFDLQPAGQGSLDNTGSQSEKDFSPLDKYAPSKPPGDTGSGTVLDLSPIQKQPDYTALDLSPAHKQEMAGFDLSPVQTRKSVEFDATSTQPHVLEIPDGITQRPVPSPRTKTTGLSKKKSKPKVDRYAHIHSSGYGHKSPSRKESGTSPARKASGTSPDRKAASSSRKGSAASPSRKGIATKQWSPASVSRHKMKGTDLPHQKQGDIQVSSVMDNQLLTSVESFAKYIQDHFTGSSSTPVTQHTKPQIQLGKEEPVVASEDKLAAVDREKQLLAEVTDWQEQWRQERKMHAKVKADLLAKEREHLRQLETQKIEYEEKLFKLKQENFVLSAKVVDETDGGPTTKALSALATADGIDKDQLERLEKEIREQEKLLAGYQQENQRLYQQMKKMQETSKASEQRMFQENQRLTTELTNLRTELDRKEVELRNKGVITGLAVQQQIVASGGEMGSAVLGAGRIAQLEAELKTARAKVRELEEEVALLRKTKQELEAHIELMVTKVQEFEVKVTQAKSSQSEEVKEMQKIHEEEMEKLNRKLRWYAENQELLDRDASSLKVKDTEIKELRAKLEHLQSETGRSQAEAKARLKERATEARKIQDLQRQVKEMEGIIKKRHPNSLPVLMWAAANAQNGLSPPKTPSVAFLEDRIQKLEKEAEEKDEEAKRSIRVLEQKYNSMKFQYEERIDTLETRLAHYERTGDNELKEGDRPHTSSTALQRELESCKERHRKRVAEMEAEIEGLKKEAAGWKAKEAAKSKSEEKQAKESESELQLRVRALQKEVSVQQQDKALLQRTVSRLQQEKQQLVTEAARQAARATDKPGKGRPGSSKNKGKKGAAEVEEVEKELPAYSDLVTRDKEYQPHSFAGSHINEVLAENEALKVRIDGLQLELEQQRIQQHKSVAEAEARERHLREETADQMAALRTAHQAELQRVLAENAMRHSVSKVAELTGKLDTQEVLVSHLKQQLAAAQVDGEQLSALKIREAGLETQVKSLLEELREAKRSHTPEMRHFEALQDQIKQLETRQGQREQELQQILRQSRQLHQAEISQEADRWRHMVETKNREIERFRRELDSILEVLGELQRQGVVLPGVQHYVGR